MCDEDHGYMLADQDVGIQYCETMLDSVTDRNIFKVQTVKIVYDSSIKLRNSQGLEHLVIRDGQLYFLMLGWVHVTSKTNS